MILKKSYSQKWNGINCLTVETQLLSRLLDQLFSVFPNFCYVATVNFNE